jgi:hypothetical protein
LAAARDPLDRADYAAGDRITVHSSVVEFCEAAPLADDLTLVLLKVL